MLEALLGAICVALAVFLVLRKQAHSKDKQQLKEYKDLFELSDQAFKEAQQTVQSLLQAAGDKDVLIERGVNAINAANNKLQEQSALVTRLAGDLEKLGHRLVFQEDQYTKLMSQKKSSEVRTGKITEQISPFLADYPMNPQTARFIGDPIDFVHFDEDKVTFVEVKSGKSQLSTKQRRIRDLIKDGKVEFIIYRVEGK